ncbi:hypothetical protein PBRA_002625 [Plasmodiophora brassicae]|uniref:Uncharacterized protein n=1 Tax=Plasmodiophora brassicae TaxID=37360 RepID=A0A0G4J4Y8_PLABS|nr:hypothetical protein PBRA_002625 [Plasmodiophora brassicae]
MDQEDARDSNGDNAQHYTNRETSDSASPRTMESGNDDDDAQAAVIDNDLARVVLFLQEEVGGVLARPIGTEPDQNMRLGKKLKNALIEWKLAGDPGDRIDRQLLNILRAHGLEHNWTARQTANAERKLRVVLRRCVPNRLPSAAVPADELNEVEEDSNLDAQWSAMEQRLRDLKRPRKATGAIEYPELPSTMKRKR